MVWRRPTWCVVPRSSLRLEDGSYAPAYQLADGRLERAGRTRTVRTPSPAPFVAAHGSSNGAASSSHCEAEGRRSNALLVVLSDGVLTPAASELATHTLSPARCGAGRRRRRSVRPCLPACLRLQRLQRASLRLHLPPSPFPLPPPLPQVVSVVCGNIDSCSTDSDAWQRVVDTNAELPGLEHVCGISRLCVGGPTATPTARHARPSADWWQLLLDGVVVPHVVHSFPSKFEGFALEGELQRVSACCIQQGLCHGRSGCRAACSRLASCSRHRRSRHGARGQGHEVRGTRTGALHARGQRHTRRPCPA
jgi:hypothetical protein